MDLVNNPRNNNMTLFQSIDEAKKSIKIWEEEIRKAKYFNEIIENDIKAWQELVKSIETAKKNFDVLTDTIKHLINFNWEKLFELFDTLPENIKCLSEEWAECGWVPSLPNYVEWKLMKNIEHPLTQSQADKIMLNKIDDEMFSLLVTKITTYNIQSGLNNETLKEAVECFNNKLYSACALLLLALVDSSFITKQPKKGRRKLAGRAVIKAIDEEKTKYSIIAQTTRLIIEKMFKDAEDFTVENGLNRNMLSHGMNKYNPDKTDCLKLFALLYNIHFLFDVTYYHFQEED